MKVLFNNPVPFMFAHGGAQIQIEQTKAALEKVGVEVEPLRWWDEHQTGDLLHHFGRMSASLARTAKAKGMKVVFVDFMTEQGSRTRFRLWGERIFRRLASLCVPRLTIAFDWQSYRLADACLAMTPYEARLMINQFGVPASKVHVVPNGIEEVFLRGQSGARGPWLVCTAIITERKRVVELAEAAVLARTPVWLIGKPYSETSPYARRLKELAHAHPQFIRYEGAISDREKLARIYLEARGFVLLSTMESLSLSTLEAAGCGAPLLLSDLPSTRAAFGQNASYCPIATPARTAKHLADFYGTAPGLKPPPKPMGWIDVARQLHGIYGALLH